MLNIVIKRKIFEAKCETYSKRCDKKNAFDFENKSMMY